MGGVDEELGRESTSEAIGIQNKLYACVAPKLRYLKDSIQALDPPMAQSGGRKRHGPTPP